ncbi:MAG: hypothetical protein M4D80_02855 [Myxococcota bacterium]|nr:hypothetical protein [Deltaproteobacteria bacterium]MDQ3334074.1 hypothetical protein [Myxococcota bacterium]
MTFIACLVAATGCRSEDKPKPPPLPIDGIEVVQPGQEPRALRYTLAASTTTPLELAMDLDLKTLDADMKLPTMVMAIDVAVTGVEQTVAQLKMTVLSATARSRVSKDEPSPEPVEVGSGSSTSSMGSGSSAGSGSGASTVSPAEQEKRTLIVMKRQANLLSGLAVTYTLTPQGHVKDSKVETVGRDLSTPMQDQVTTLLQASEQLAMALPDKPVGVGAIWKHRRTIKQNQLTLVSMTTVEVTAIDGDRVSFKSKTEMTGADQTIAQGSASAQVTAIRGTGAQTGTFDLGKAIVLGEQQATLSFEMNADGQRRPTKVAITTRISPRE